MLDPDGVTKTTALGADRMARRLHEALNDAEHPLRGAVWTPMLSPRLAALNADAFVAVDVTTTTVDLATHRGESTLDDLALGDEHQAAAAA